MNCDRVAPIYRWLEYLVFGRKLEFCRNYFLSDLADCHNALVLGDGDGRFLTNYLRANEGSDGTVDYVDVSEGMLRLARQRAASLNSGDRQRVRFLCCDARKLDDLTKYDLIATHFFLDCLEEWEIEVLAGRIQQTARRQVLWVVSEFCIPKGLMMRLFGLALMSTMYFCFRFATGLEVRKLPDYRGVLLRCGFRLREAHYRFGGLLVSELWSGGRQ